MYYVLRDTVFHKLNKHGADFRRFNKKKRQHFLFRSLITVYYLHLFCFTVGRLISCQVQIILNK